MPAATVATGDMEGPVLYRLHLIALPCDASGHTPRPCPEAAERPRAATAEAPTPDSLLIGPKRNLMPLEFRCVFRRFERGSVDC